MAVPRIIQVAGNLDRVQLPVADATALEVGDLISYESNACTLLNAAGDDATFAGYAINQRLANGGTPQEMVVGMKGLVKYDCTSATYGFGDGLLYTAENKLAADAGANTLAWAAEDESGTAVTRIVALINVPALAKLFGVDA